MTNLVQIERLAKVEFIPFLKTHGFLKEAVGLYVKRLPSGVMQVISLESVRGSHGRLWATAITQGMLQHEQETPGDKLSHRLIVYHVGGQVGERGVGVFGSYMESIESEKEIQMYLRECTGLIERVVLPWFSLIQDRDQLWALLEKGGATQGFRSYVYS